MPSLGSPRPNIAITLGVEKLEWCGYPTVKKIEDMFTRFHRIHERVGQTDRQADKKYVEKRLLKMFLIEEDEVMME